MSQQPSSGGPPDGTSTDIARIRAGLGYVCTHRAELREDLAAAPPPLPGTAAAGRPGLLFELAAAFAAGRDCGPLLDAIDEALKTSGDALGLYGRATAPGPRTYFEPPGLPGPVPRTADETVYLCPVARCSGYVWPAPDARPSCSLTGRPMRADRL